MLKRNFLKLMLGVAATPVIAKIPIENKPVVIGIDMAKKGADHSVVIQRYKLSRNQVVTKWGIDSDGGYMYSDELSKKLREAMQPNFPLSTNALRKTDQSKLNHARSIMLDNLTLSEN